MPCDGPPTSITWTVALAPIPSLAVTLTPVSVVSAAIVYWSLTATAWLMAGAPSNPNPISTAGSGTCAPAPDGAARRAAGAADFTFLRLDTSRSVRWWRRGPYGRERTQVYGRCPRGARHARPLNASRAFSGNRRG